MNLQVGDGKLQFRLAGKRRRHCAHHDVHVAALERLCAFAAFYVAELDSVRVAENVACDLARQVHFEARDVAGDRVAEA